MSHLHFDLLGKSCRCKCCEEHRAERTLSDPERSRRGDEAISSFMLCSHRDAESRSFSFLSASLRLRGKFLFAKLHNQLFFIIIIRPRAKRRIAALHAMDFG